MQKIRSLKDTSPMAYIAAAILFGIFIVLLTALPIAMIVIGSTNQNNCTIETRIPVWLIVQGSVSIFLALILVLTTVLQLSSDNVKLFISVITGCFVTIVSLFQFAWFIYGNVLVYSKHSTVQYSDTSLSTYCDKTLYLFSFWIITVTYILMGVSIIGGILVGFCACCCAICCGMAASGKR